MFTYDEWKKKNKIEDNVNDHNEDKQDHKQFTVMGTAKRFHTKGMKNHVKEKQRFKKREIKTKDEIFKERKRKEKIHNYEKYKQKKDKKGKAGGKGSKGGKR
ncbi:hypothetical protein LOTGIDRAFT_166105 [Lottia gigantea]|uniref:Uncharacterized protein n=1 Tax=Lottia gigantea TaxID=225164 RepID=V3ZTU2_LOTGI|nr:hypothetical protein LOTGIDRAFT_166105 [Lottia gigantea]ESO87807.1 hypothetical protein LOTGIDRAFT_166105 [Lottia gigantea]